MPLERELKFSVAEAYQPSLPELEQAFEGTPYAVEALPAVRVRDTYHDDDAGRLRRAGLALRLRRSPGSVLATLKTAGSALDGLHERDELELPATGGAWPDPLRERVAAVTEPAALVPRLELASWRLRFRVRSSGLPVALVSFDEVEASRPGGETRVTFNEVEVEAEGDADAATLRGIAERLELLVTLVPDPASKLERAEALLAVVEA